jgi:hypothetical protein
MSQKDEAIVVEQLVDIAALVEMCKRIEKKLDEVVIMIHDLDEDESEDELPATQEDEDFIDDSPEPARKKVKLTYSKAQLKPYGYSRAGTFGGPSRGGYNRGRGGMYNSSQKF